MGIFSDYTQKGNKMFDTKKIEKARVLKGLRKSEVARRAGYSPATYTLVLKGRVQNPPTIKAIADVLGLSMEEIYIEQDPIDAVA